MSETWLRVRQLLDRRFALVVALLLVVAAVGMWVTYDAYATPETTTVERTVQTGRITGTLSHGAAVTADASGTGFEPGSRVTNRTVYFDAVMPVLSGNATVGYRGRVPARVRIERSVRIRSVSSGTEDGTVVYWNRTLSSETVTTTLRSGGRERVPFRLNVSRTAAEAERVSERLGSPGDVELRVLVDMTVRRQVRTASIRRLSYNLTIEPQGAIYRVESNGRAETFTRTVTATRRVEPGPLRAFGGPLLAFVCLVDVVGLAYARRAGALGLSEHETAWLDYRDDRDEFDEWITTVQLPEDARTLPVAEAETLADLVDFAIDTDNAVMESPGERTFHVVHDGYRYVFSAPAPPASESPASAEDDEEGGSDDGESDPPSEPGELFDADPSSESED